ncbi:MULTISPECIES: sulfite exporter TauE/SafE family protein [Ruegeria]|uniref:sulfite exporter TauE/SafE family protein n=1 Tax=Ruegeria TaxID=97050 RepID=UPI00147B8334|nr:MULTISPECIES: sulfite exporter TauE/SafE family protein [Ruegeria]MBY6081580.1 sulfite exporter TauE/SafE family protein [Ruegeria arenilitoris]UWR06065.1 sulfite exporter TauE/SafE family protein [Ruegeria sp. B32]
MPDVFGQSPTGLAVIIFAALAGGIVRGFSGFGTALIFLPLSTPYLGPFGALIALTCMDVFGPLPNLRRAWVDVDKRDLVRLVVGCALLLPVGLSILTRVQPEVFRYAVSLVTLFMLVVLISGLRYNGEVRRNMVTAIGAAAGFLGGVAGIPGPAVILFYMSRPLPVAVVRATILLFLLAFDFLIFGYLAAFGQLTWSTVGLGLALAVPNLAGNWLGGWMFQPARERVYRVIAYAVIAAAALSGLPLWG